QNVTGACTLVGSRAGANENRPSVSQNGNLSVTPSGAGTATYSVTCHGKTGLAGTATVNVTVIPPPTVHLTASPTTVHILFGTHSTTLTWTSTNAVSCRLSGTATANEPPSGSVSETPFLPGSFDYTMTCTNPAGSASQTVTVTASLF
ncbi:MAG: hypothetical protein L0H29_06745, partial [Sinobacteraceae bacterium]|nr:hypothetical protein [Nevskiaceae bacterium]